MSTVRCSSWPIETARLKAMVVLPTPPFGAKTEKMRVLAFSWSVVERLADAADPVDEVEAGERHRQDAVDAPLRIGLDGVLRHGQDDDRHAESGLVDLLDEARALDPALQERVDDHDVRSQFLDLERGPCRLHSGRRAA